MFRRPLRAPSAPAARDRSAGRGWLWCTLFTTIVLGTVPANAQCVVRDGDLVLWLPGDGSGEDIQGTNDASLLNGAGYALGMVGDGFSLDGSNDRVSVADSADFDFGSALTIELWVQTDTLLVSQGIVEKSRCVVGEPGFIFLLVPVAGGLRLDAVFIGAMNCSAPGRIQSTAAAITDSNLHHVAVTYAGGASPVARLYVDGAEVSSSVVAALPSSINSNGQPLRIGALMNSGGTHTSHFDGVLDEVSLYDRALSLGEIEEIYLADSDGKCKVVDVDPPLLTLTSPADGAVSGAVEVLVSLSVTDASATQVVFAPQGSVPSFDLPAGGGSVDALLPLSSEGPNVLVVTATDAAGNVASTSVMVVRDTTLPQIVSITPAAGAVLALSPARMVVAVDDATAMVVRFGPHAIGVPAPGGAVSGMIDLVEGDNLIAITLTDAAGNVASADHLLRLDSSAPLVTIDRPQDGTAFGPGELPIVMATIDDDSATVVTSVPDGVAGNLPRGGGIVIGAVQLVEGWNRVAVTAVDDVGLSSSASVLLLLDGTPPAVAVDAPREGDSVRGLFTLRASAGDSLPSSPGTGVERVEFYVDGVRVASLAAAPFETLVDSAAYADGLHTLEAVALDRKSNMAVAAVVVLVDNTACEVTLVEPHDGTAVGGVFAVVAEAEDDGAGVAGLALNAAGANVDGVLSPTPAGGLRFEGSVDTAGAPPGPLTLEAVAVDEAGNSSAHAVVVLVEGDGSLEQPLVAPRDGERVSGVIEIVADSPAGSPAELELLVDGCSLGVSGRAPFRVAFDSASRLDGEMEITAVARDGHGNEARSSARVTVDNMSVDLRPESLCIEHAKRTKCRKAECEERCGRSCGAKAESGRKRAKKCSDDDSRCRKCRCLEGVVLAQIDGPNLRLLREDSRHPLSLQIPGGGSVTGRFVWRGDRLRERRTSRGTRLFVEFDRHALVAALRAAVCAGVVARDSDVLVRLVTADGFVLGEDAIRIRGG